MIESQAEDSFVPTGTIPHTVLLDGLWGSGKSLLAPVIGRLRDVSHYRISGVVDNLVGARAQRLISKGFFESELIAHLVSSQVANSLGREINLRILDDSFYFRGGGKLTDLLRGGLRRDSETGFDEYIANSRRYFEMTHLISLTPDDLLSLDYAELKLVTIRRNPVFLVESNFSYLKQTFSTTRDRSFGIAFGGHKVPVAAKEWSDEWIRCTLADRAALMAARFSRLLDKNYAHEIENGSAQKMWTVTSFSRLISEPLMEIERLASFMGVSVSHRSKSTLLRSLIPAGNRAGARPDSDPDAIQKKIGRLSELLTRPVQQELIQAAEEFESTDF